MHSGNTHLFGHKTKGEMRGSVAWWWGLTYLQAQHLVAISRNLPKQPPCYKSAGDLEEDKKAQIQNIFMSILEDIRLRSITKKVTQKD